jgi:hypothetical protein
MTAVRLRIHKARRVSAVELARVSWRVAVLQAQQLPVAAQLEAASTQAEVVQQVRAPRARVLRAAPVHRVMTTQVLRSAAAAARRAPLARVQAALVDRPHRVVAAVRVQADRAAARPVDRAVRAQVAPAVERVAQPVALRERVVAAAFPELADSAPKAPEPRQP